MSIVIVVFAVMLLIVLIMSVGAIFAGKPITGSCGGLSAIGMKSSCDVCSGKDEDGECRRKKKQRIEAKQLED